MFLKLIRAAGFAILVVMGVALSAMPANADPFGVGPPDAGYKADSSDHTWCTYGSFANAWYNPIKRAMDNLDSQTEMSDTYVSVCASTTDAQIYLSNSATMGANTLGSYSCLVATGGGSNCEAARVRLNQEKLTTEDYRQKTTCHEVGHSVGLSHGSTYGGCMVSGLSNNKTYSSHHVSHINANY